MWHHHPLLMPICVLAATLVIKFPVGASGKAAGNVLSPFTLVPMWVTQRKFEVSGSWLSTAPATATAFTWEVSQSMKDLFPSLFSSLLLFKVNKRNLFKNIYYQWHLGNLNLLYLCGRKATWVMCYYTNFPSLSLAILY